MKLQIKYEKEKFPIEIDNSATVKDLKRLIGKMKNCKISQIQLIYSAEVLQNSQTLESQINNLNKPISLFINEVTPKKKKKNSQSQLSENSPVLPAGFENFDSSTQIRDESFFQLAQYVSKPDIRKMLYDQDIQNGLQLIYQGIEKCHDSGNTKYDYLLENLKLMMPAEQYSPTPPPSSSPSASSLAVSSVHDSNSEKVTSVINENNNTENNNTKNNNTENNDIENNNAENKQDVDYMTLYKDKLQEMEEMGLANKEINLKALIENNGDVDDAIEWMIQNGDLTE